MSPMPTRIQWASPFCVAYEEADAPAPAPRREAPKDEAAPLP